jgi:hypothetical protein
MPPSRGPLRVSGYAKNKLFIQTKQLPTVIIALFSPQIPESLIKQNKLSNVNFSLTPLAGSEHQPHNL